MKKNVIRVVWYCEKNRRKKGLKRKKKQEKKIICILEHEIYDTKTVVAWIHKSKIFHATRSQVLNLELIDSMQKIHGLCHLGNDNKRTRESDGDMYMLEAFVHVSIKYTLVSTRQ